MPNFSRFGAIFVICSVVILLVIGMVTLLSPHSLSSIIGLSVDATATPRPPSPGQGRDLGTPLPVEAAATTTAAAILEIQPFASTPNTNGATSRTPATSKTVAP